MKNYYLCDLHFHTNDSYDAFENSGEKSINLFDINKVINALKGTNVENDVRLLVFTDHNVFNYEHFKVNFELLKSKGILLLPGIEINTTNKVHWVFIFDDNELSIIEKGKTKGSILTDTINEFYRYDLSKSLLEQARLAQNTPVNVTTFIDKINSLGLDYIAIPHFNKDKGYMDAMKKHPEVIDALNLYIKDNIVYSIEGPNCKEYVKSQADKTQKHLGEYIDKLTEITDSTPIEEINKIQNGISNRQEYLNKVRKMERAVKGTCEIHGSDFHGKNTSVSYVKDDLFVMKSDLSYRGLKFALLDFESRIFTISEYKKYQKDNNYVIDNIRININGTNKEIKFGDGLNCIIGSRGSGKTYLLSLLTGDTNNYKNTTIGSNISLSSINLTNGKNINKLDKNMYDYISQRSNTFNKKKDDATETKFNIYDLLARAPYDYELFVGKLKDSFSSNVGKKTNKIDDFFVKANEIIESYVKIKGYYDDKSVNYDLIKKYNEVKVDNLNNRITRLFTSLNNTLSNNSTIYHGKITEIDDFKDKYETYLSSLKSITSFKVIKELMNNNSFDTDKYIEDTEKIYNLISTIGSSTVKEKTEEIDLLLNRTQSILRKCKSTITNNEKTINEFATNFRTYVNGVVSTLRTIVNNTSKLKSLDVEELINQENFTFGQDSNKLDVRVESKLNIKDINVSNHSAIFGNYNTLIYSNDVLEKIFLSDDLGEYFIDNIYDKKDGRKHSYSLIQPDLEKNIYLIVDDTNEKNWAELSPGERSNLLLNIILLNDCSKILLIDQPEDDLDNETIFNKIVSRLRELKLKRQIIIVTHNANLAITADCDYLIICESKNDGSYDVINDSMESSVLYDYYSINNARGDKHLIIDIAAQILDGGKEALRHRVKKIGYKGLFLDKEI